MLREKEEAEVQAVLVALARSPLVARLFSYLCQRYFDGEAEQLNEIKIAKEVFGRPDSFDRSQDAIARVEAHRLRKKLKQYYEAEGRDHEVQISLPPGSYVPVFLRPNQAVDPALNGQPDPQRNVPPPAGSPLPETAAHNGNPPGAIPPPPPEEPLPPAQSPALRRIWFAVGAIVILAGALLIAWRARTLFNQSESGAANKRVAVAGNAGAYSPAIRIVCGYNGPPHIGHLGEVWTGDKYFHGGSSWPARRGFIRAASDPFLFANTRRGEFSYDIPVKPGVYELHLYFVETDYGEDLGGGENSRTFAILLNNRTLFQSFDPLADAGGPWIADERVFKDVYPARDGKVHVVFQSQRGQPMLSAIELLPGIPHKQIPIRLVTQVNSYTDHTGQVWAPDNYYMEGQIFGDKPPVSGTLDPGLFATERAGNFRYAIPADTHGSYTANLYFAETYFGPAASGVGGVGSRVFNVMCNGSVLLQNFDVFKEAGSLKAVEESFHGLKPDAQGKLMFWFEPVANYASVFGIEVLDESE